MTERAKELTLPRDLLEDIYHELLIGTADRLIAIDDLERGTEEYNRQYYRYERAVETRQRLREALDRGDFEAGLAAVVF